MVKKKPTAEELFLEAWNVHGWKNSDLVREYKFHPIRRWRFDFAFPSRRVAIEVDGRGRHQTVQGVRRDCEKANAAAELGWIVLRIPTSDIRGKDKFGEPLVSSFIELVRTILEHRENYEQARLHKGVETLQEMSSS